MENFKKFQIERKKNIPFFIGVLGGIMMVFGLV